MKSVYTRTGDGGDTGLIGDERVPKFDIRIEAIGTLDEVNAVLGIARVFATSERIKKIILDLQRDLYRLMSEVGASAEVAERFKFVTEEKLQELEALTDEITRAQKPPHGFITPGDTKGGAYLDLARAVVRRAERRLVEMDSQGLLFNRLIIKYVNRLSSLLFVLEIDQTQTSKKTVTLAKVRKV